MNNNDLEQKSKQNNWASIVDRYVPAVVKSFMSALPTLLIWISIPSCLLVLGLILQWGIPQRTSTINGNIIQTIEFTGEPDNTLVLFISHPKKLFIYPLGTPQEQSVSLWLEYATPTFGFTPTATITPTSSKTPTPTPSSINNTSQPGIITQLDQPVEASELDTYNIYFLATPKDIMFVNRDGIAVPYHILLTPSDKDITPAVLYLQPQPGNSGKTEIGISIDNVPTGKNKGIQIDVERSKFSYLRQIGIQICGMPLFIGALITSLIGFAIQDWNKNVEKLQKQQEFEREFELEINILANSLRNSESDCARYYIELRSRRNLVWLKQDNRKKLDNIFKSLVDSNLYWTARLSDAKNDRKRMLKIVEEIGSIQMEEILKHVSESNAFDGDWRREAREIAKILKSFGRIERSNTNE
jgi:hypothetical protein